MKKRDLQEVGRGETEPLLKSKFKRRNMCKQRRKDGRGAARKLTARHRCRLNYCMSSSPKGYHKE